MEPITFNARLSRMKPSASLMLMPRAKEMQKKGPSVIGLAVGEPDFPTPDRICMEAVRRMAQGIPIMPLVQAFPSFARGYRKSAWTIMASTARQATSL